MNLKKMSSFKQRLIISSIGVPLALIIISLSFIPIFQPIFILMIAGFQSLALWEYYHLAEEKGYSPQKKWGVATNVFYLCSVFLTIQLQTKSKPWPELILLLSLLISFLIYFRKSNRPLANLSLTWFGILYITITLATLVNINYFFIDGTQDGRIWLIYLLTISKVTDTGAYLFGKTFGKHKLAPQISPKKTIEGAIGGLFTAIVTSYCFYLINQFFHPHSPIQLTLWQSLWLGFILSILAQIGDLAESLLKRDAEVKDSSRLPGLGGFLDIVDSLIFTAPLLYLLLQLEFL